MKKKFWPSEKILQSRIWNWIKIIGGIVAVLAGITTLIDWWGDHFIYDKFFGPQITIEQTISPEAMKKARESNSPIRIEKGITIYPKEK